MISVIAVMAVLAAMLAAPMAVFGDETWMFRDDRIKADFPDGEVTECDSMTVDSDEVRNFEKIAEAVLDDERGTMVAGIYFIADESSDGDYYYLSSDSEEADNYYVNYGEKAIREMYSNIEDSKLVSLIQDGQYISDWYTFIRVIADVKTGSGTHSEAIYLTAASTDSYTVSKAIVLSPAEGSVLSADYMEDMAKPVIDSFFDYGYDGVMVGESYDDEYASDDYDSDFDAGNIMNTLIAAAAILSAVAALVSAVKKKRRENSETLNAGALQVFQLLLQTANQQLKALNPQVPDLTVETYAEVLDGLTQQMTAAKQTKTEAFQSLQVLKAQLDSYNQFYTGLTAYTAGVDQLSANMPALTDGATALNDGAAQLYAGLQTLDQDGLQTLTSMVNDEWKPLFENARALADDTEAYQSYAGKADDAEGVVRFIWRTDAIGD